MRRSSAEVAVLAAMVCLVGCGEDPDAGPGPPTVTASEPGQETTDDDTSQGRPRVVDTVATGLEVPWGVAFLPDGRAVVTERDSRNVLLVDPEGDGTEVVGRLEQASPEGEAGLLGVEVSPEFDDDGLLFFYVTTAEDNRVVRAELSDDGLGEPEVVLAGIPKGPIHDGGRLLFGPDGMLHVSTGETGRSELAQDGSSLAGKILRITPDGEPAPGNPDPDSPVLTSGHRNVQGLALDDEGNLWASEFGASTFDELNLIEPGENYGWPEVEGRGAAEGFVNPRIVWSTDEASPSGLAYADGRLWLGALRGARLWRVDVADGGASDPTPFFVGEYGRLRTVARAPDGRLWVTTSNRDGRGDPADEDDRILVVEPGGRPAK